MNKNNEANKTQQKNMTLPNRFSNNFNVDLNNPANINPNYFASGNLSRLSKGSKKVSINENVVYTNNFNLSNKNMEMGCYRKSLGNQSFKQHDTERKSVNSRNRKSLSDKKSFSNLNSLEALAIAEKIRLEKENKKQSEEEVKYSDEKFKKSRRRLFVILKDHKRFLVGAGIAAALNGAVWPVYGILLADAIGTLSEKDVVLVKSGGIIVAISFVCLALAAALVLWMQKYVIYLFVYLFVSFIFYYLNIFMNASFNTELLIKYFKIIFYFYNKV